MLESIEPDCTCRVYYMARCSARMQIRRLLVPSQFRLQHVESQHDVDHRFDENDFICGFQICFLSISLSVFAFPFCSPVILFFSFNLAAASFCFSFQFQIRLITPTTQTSCSFEPELFNARRALYKAPIVGPQQCAWFEESSPSR